MTSEMVKQRFSIGLRASSNRISKAKLILFLDLTKTKDDDSYRNLLLKNILIGTGWC